MKIMELVLNTNIITIMNGSYPIELQTHRSYNVDQIKLIIILSNELI